MSGTYVKAQLTPGCEKSNVESKMLPSTLNSRSLVKDGVVLSCHVEFFFFVKFHAFDDLFCAGVSISGE